MEATQHQVVQVKGSERAIALIEVKGLCDDFDFSADMLKVTLSKRRGER